MDNLLSYRFEDNIVIIRGFVNLDRFPSQEELPEAINKLPTAAPEPILSEQDRQDIPTSPTCLPAIYNKIANQIRSPIQQAIDVFNKHHEEDNWELRSIRNDGCNHIIHSKKVLVSRQFAVQDHHHDSHGYRPDLISCFIGLRDNTRLQVFNEHEIVWNEFTYHRGDIFLMKSHKAHRGTNYADQITRLMNVIADDPGSSGTDQAWYQLLLKIQAVQWMALKGVPEAAAQQSTTKLTTQGEVERQRFAGAAQQAMAAVPSIRTMPVPPTGNPHLNALLAAMGILRGYVPPQPEQQQ
jgi:hypothetical protein